MSEAPVTVSDGRADARREMGPGGARGVGRPAHKRSLKDALSDAGLSDADLGEPPKDDLRPVSPRQRGQDNLDAVPALRLRSVLLHNSERDFSGSDVDDANSWPDAVQPSAVVEEVPPLLSASSRQDGAHGVVSPPPWLRAARRGRWRARTANAVGWLVTIMVAGSIMTLAGRYLAVPPGGFESVYTARN